MKYFEISQVAVIPMKDYPDYSEELLFNGEPYIVRFRWNSRAKFWVMSVSLRDGTVIVAGMKIVINFPLNIRYSSPLLPAGAFIAFDANEKTQFMNPGQNDFISGRLVQMGFAS